MENDCRNSAECPEGQLLEKTLIILRKKKKNKERKTEDMSPGKRSPQKV